MENLLQFRQSFLKQTWSGFGMSPQKKGNIHQDNEKIFFVDAKSDFNVALRTLLPVLLRKTKALHFIYQKLRFSLAPRRILKRALQENQPLPLTLKMSKWLCRNMRTLSV